MPYSYAERANLTCPNCGTSFRTDIWLLVDMVERPDLAEHIQAGTLHDLTCFHCGQDMGQVDVPLLLYRPDKTPPLLFSPAESTTNDQDQEQAAALVGRLRQALAGDWQDTWLAQGLVSIPRHLLPAALSDDPATTLVSMNTARQQTLSELWQHNAHTDEDSSPETLLLQTLQQFIQIDTWSESQHVVETHPELLTDEACDLLERLANAANQHGDAAAENMFAEHRALLRRCQEVGVAQAFTEKKEERRTAPLVQTMREFIEAGDWNESQRIVEAHPELLTSETDRLLDHLVDTARQRQEADIEQTFVEHRALLRRCQEVGVAKAFAEKRREPSPSSNGPEANLPQA